MVWILLSPDHSLFVKVKYIHMDLKIETSAGGVVYRKTGDKIEIIIGKHSGHHRWVLPKGWVEEGETKEETAKREVKEEVGVEVEVGEPIGDFYIYFTNEAGKHVRKTNYFFLMKYISGDPVKGHGWEMEEAKWVLPSEAVEELTYPSEKEIVQKAVKLI